MLAGNMKLNTFLLLAGALGGAVCAGGGVWIAMRPAEPEAAVVNVSTLPAPAPATHVPSPNAASPSAASPSAPAEAPAPAAPANARPVDVVVFSYVGKSIGSDKLKDVTKGKPFKVNVYQDSGKPTANRAKVDLDRDDKWDEKYTFDGDTITREVAPKDDEVYTQKFRWDGKDWVTG